MGSRNPTRRTPRRRLTPSINARTISRRRAYCISEIIRLRDSSADAASALFVDKAHRLLLPKYWSGADWRVRAEILAAVEWLLRVGERAAASGNPPTDTVSIHQ